MPLFSALVLSPFLSLSLFHSLFRSSSPFPVYTASSTLYSSLSSPISFAHTFCSIPLSFLPFLLPFSPSILFHPLPLCPPLFLFQSIPPHRPSTERQKLRATYPYSTKITTIVSVLNLVFLLLLLRKSSTCFYLQKKKNEMVHRLFLHFKRIKKERKLDQRRRKIELIIPQTYRKYQSCLSSRRQIKLISKQSQTLGMLRGLRS